MKWQICQIARTSRELDKSRNTQRYDETMKTIEKMFIDTRKARDNINHNALFGNHDVDDKRRLEELDNVLEAKIYLQNNFNCAGIMQEKQCVNVNRKLAETLQSN